MKIKEEISKRPVIFLLLVLVLTIIVVDSFLPVIFLRNHYTKHPEATCYKYLILDNGKQTRKGNHISYNAKVINWYDSHTRLWKNCKGEIKLYQPRFNEDSLENKPFSYGDVVSSSDEMLPISNFSEDFNYVRYMKHQRIYHSVFVNHWRVVETNQGNFFVGLSKKINERLHDRILFSGMKKETSQLAVAMLLGDKTEMNPDIRQSFNAAGLGHILCVSGLHIGILMIFFTYILSLILPNINNRIYIINWCSILIVWLLNAIVGFTPSATRVAMLLTVLYLCKMYMLYYDRINVLLVVAFVSLVLKPHLLFNIRFQLSYLSVLGIFICDPYFDKWKMKKQSFVKPFLNKLLSNLSMSTSAQVFTLPITLVNFGYFPVFFLISNLIVLPVLQLALISLIALLIFVDVPLLSNVIAFCCDVELGFIIWVTNLLS